MVDTLTSLVVRLQNAVYDLRHREEGQGLVEYVTLIALIALGLFAALIVFRDELGTIFSKITNKIQANLP